MLGSNPDCVNIKQLLQPTARNSYICVSPTNAKGNTAKDKFCKFKPFEVTLNKLVQQAIVVVKGFETITLCIDLGSLKFA